LWETPFARVPAGVAGVAFYGYRDRTSTSQRDADYFRDVAGGAEI
jgi:hypothetical protein